MLEHRGWQHRQENLVAVDQRATLLIREGPHVYEQVRRRKKDSSFG
jgi:hypothetical protein